MLRSVFASQRNRAMVALSGRVPLTTTRALFSTNAAEVFDDEANREQLEQVSQQMEDAMHKEKQITQMQQVTGQSSTQMWDANTQTAKPSSDNRVSQSRSVELNAINKEQQDQTRQHVGDDLEKQSNYPMGFQTDGPSRTRNYSNTVSDSKDNTVVDPDKVLNQMKDMATGAVDLAAGAVNMAAGVGKVVAESAKSTMQNVKEMMPSAPSKHSTNEQDWNSRDQKSEGFMPETAKVLKETTKDMIDDVMKPSVDSPGKVDEQMKKQREQRERQGTNKGRATQAGEEKSRGKQVSDHRQNASLL